MEKETPRQDHGRIAPVPTERKKGPYLPPELRGRVLTYNLTAEKDGAEQGWWKVRISRRIWVAGKVVEEGDICEVPGSQAAELVMMGAADFIDPRKGRFEVIQKEMQQLQKPLSAREQAKLGK